MEPSFLQQRFSAFRRSWPVVVVLVMLGVSSVSARAQDPDRLYQEEQYEEAEALYKRLDMDRPKDARYRYNRGCAAYQQEDFQGALAAFSSARKRAGDPSLRFRAAYNAGNAAFNLGDLASARDLFVEALSLRPGDPDAMHNLELTLHALAQQESKKENRKGEGNQEQKEEEDQQEHENGSSEKHSDQDTRQTHGEDHGQDQGQDQEKGQPDSDDLRDAPSPKEAPKQAVEEKEQPNMEQRMAEALLDNQREDLSRFLQMQIPPSTPGVLSGKDW